MVTSSVELHLHTCYSFLEGASLPEELANRAADLGYRALAITDHDGLHGAMEFAQACAGAGIQPITGVELTLQHGLVDAASGPVHLTLLAEREQRLRQPVPTDHARPPRLAVLGKNRDPPALGRPAPAVSGPDRSRGTPKG